MGWINEMKNAKKSCDAATLRLIQILLVFALRRAIHYVYCIEQFLHSLLLYHECPLLVKTWLHL